jgi:pyruvate-formate lyase-activating enzyme
MEIRFILVSNCNADCYFCLNEYVGTKSAKFNLYPSHFAQIMYAANTLGVNDCTLTGGEPTLRKDLADITEQIKPHTSRLTMISNGYLLAERIDSLAFVDELHVSLHSMIEEEWYRVTKVKGGLAKVLRNLEMVRNKYPHIRIKLNVVAEEQNSSNNQIDKYLAFAKSINCELNLFQEGYFSFLKEMGVGIKNSPQRFPWWNLSGYSLEILSKSKRKTTYDVEGVKLALSLTSTDKISWDSCWITPLGAGFVNIKHDTYLVDFLPALASKNRAYLENGLISLFNEADLEIQKDQNLINEEIYTSNKFELMAQRKSNFMIAEPVPVSNLIL